MKDPGIRKAPQAAVEASKLKSEYEAYRNNDIATITNAIKEAQAEAITLFPQEKDAYGRLTHPHFNKVRAKMVELLGRGASEDLEEVYHMAVASSPKVRQMERKTNPSLSLTNSPAGTSSNKAGSLTLRQAWDQSLAELGYK